MAFRLEVVDSGWNRRVLRMEKAQYFALVAVPNCKLNCYSSSI
jgi:hypothetical protein